MGMQDGKISQTTEEDERSFLEVNMIISQPSEEWGRLETQAEGKYEQSPSGTKYHDEKESSRCLSWLEDKDQRIKMS